MTWQDELHKLCTELTEAQVDRLSEILAGATQAEGKFQYERGYRRGYKKGFNDGRRYSLERQS